jgi:hypothetical protein
MSKLVDSGSKSIRTYDGIISDCVKDHKDYIMSYVGKDGQTELLNEYKNDKRRYKEIKQILFNIAKQYPRFMSFLLDPHNSGISSDEITVDILNRLRKTGKMKGGGKKDVEIMVKSMQSLFDEYAKTAPLKIHGKTQDMMNHLTDIETNLKTIEGNVKRGDLVNPLHILNNLSDISAKLGAYIPATGYTVSHTSKISIIPSTQFDFEAVKKSSNLMGIMSNTVNGYLGVIFGKPKKIEIENIMNIVMSTNDLEKIKVDLNTAFETDEAKKIVIDLKHALDIDTKEDIFVKKRKLIDVIINYIKESKTVSFDDEKSVNMIIENYEGKIGEINKNIQEIATLNKSLDVATKETEEYLYGSKNDNSSISTYILPKIRTIMGIMRLHQNNKDNTILMQNLIKKYDAIKFKDGSDYSMPDFSKNIQSTVKELLKGNPASFFDSCTKYEISKKIMIYNEKIMIPEVGEFIELYNSTMEKDYNESKVSIADTLNIYYAQLCKSYIENSTGKLITKLMIETEETNYNIDMVNATNVKRFREPANKADFDGAIANATIASNELTNVIEHIRKNLYKTDINTIADAKRFMHSYNKVLDKLKNTTINGIDKSTIKEQLFYAKLPSRISLIPTKYFLRDYTERIDNNIFSTVNEQKLLNIKALEKLVDKSLGDTNNLDAIYAPEFKNIMQSLGKKKSLRGGGINEIVGNMTDIANKYISLANEIDIYNQSLNKYSIVYNEVYSYTQYLILIATNQLFTENYIVYKYINRGLIELYKRIVGKMIKDLDSNDASNHILHIKKYYNVVIRRLGNFLESISNFMKESTDLIDIRNIDNTSSEIRNNMILLNYFKPIIETYNEAFQAQITIYARLNDIVGEIDYNSKVFVSDHEMLKAIGCNFKSLGNRDAVEQADLKKQCAKNQDNTVMGGNSSIMWVRDLACKAKNVENTIKGQDSNFDRFFKFTEVFDTVNFPENSDISKYMTLETQLAKKKGVSVLTYGYSGTGKTYTLFGNNEKQGVLQSTLVGINGLYKVKFRLFEIYGRGFSYDFYWNDRDAKKSRINDIDHKIFHYNLDIVGSDIKVKNGEDDVISIEAKDFSDYINEKDLTDPLDKKCVSINSKDIQKVFSNFSKFTESIDKYRKGEGKSPVKNIKRIRETPNNPESSRSILVYDFKLYVGTEKDTEDEKDAVKFLIVDLPGREEINQTYIKPYLDNDIMRDILGSGDTATKRHAPNNPNIEKIRMLITCMALNPMALAVFNAEEIINVINGSKIRKEVYDKILNNKINTNIVNGIDTGVELSEVMELDGKDILVVKSNTVKSNTVKSNTVKSNTVKSKTVKLFGYDDEYQKKGLGAIFVMYELISKNKFDLIKEIYAKIVDIEINKKIKAYLELGANKTIDKYYKLMYDLIYKQFKGERTTKTIKELIEKITGEEKKASETDDEHIKRRDTFMPRIDGETSIEFITRREKIIKDKMIDLNFVQNELEKVLKYDYLLTPLEGIYINENIIGLIKYLASKLIKDEGDKAKIEVLDKKKTEQQPMVLNDMRNIARAWLMSKELSGDYTGGKSGDIAMTNLNYMKKIFNLSDNEYTSKYFDANARPPAPVPVPVPAPDIKDNAYSGVLKYTKIDGDVKDNPDDIEINSTSVGKLTLDIDQIIKQQKFLSESYDSSKIFNFDKPLITDILEKYIEKDVIETELEEDKKEKIEHNLTAIKDYKLFYLFGNYNTDPTSQFKCIHQINLLDNTKNFIQAVTGQT